MATDAANHSITLGAATGTKSLALYGRGAPSTFAVQSTGAGHDLTIAVSGANDASVLVTSTGTGADAIYLNASQGTLLLDARNGQAQALQIKNGGAAMLDVDTTTNQLAGYSSPGV